MISMALFPELVDSIIFSMSDRPELCFRSIRYAIHDPQSAQRYVKSIVSDKILSEVNVETAAGVVASVITTASLKALKLKKGTWFPFWSRQPTFPSPRTKRLLIRTFLVERSEMEGEEVPEPAALRAA